jgi:4-amino-4-deoxy-L-arabinose transferase-like glycosyltransferase
MFATYFPPLFHIFLSFIYRPLIWLGLEAWRIKIDIVIFALFYMVAFWCIYQIAKKLFSWKTALTVLLILILWYPFIFLNYLVMSENLFFVLMFLGLYIIVVRSQDPLNGFAAGILWGLAAATRPIFAPAIALFFLWAFFTKTNKKYLFCFIISVGVVLASMMAFNLYYTNGEEKSISSNGGAAFATLWCQTKSIQFNGPGYFYWFAPPANEACPESSRVFTNVPFTNQQYYYEMGLGCVTKNPQGILQIASSSVIKNFDSQLFPTTSNVPYWQGLRILFKILTINLLIAGLMSLTAIFFDLGGIKKEYKKYFFLFAIIVLSLLATTFIQSVGEERYIIPYQPLLILLSVPIINILIKLAKKYAW